MSSSAARRTRAKAKKSWEIRECGDCTACCTVLGVEEIGKDEFTACKHACNGCAIYASRPTVCRTYSCAWKLGALPHELRPDKCNLIVDTTNRFHAISVREVRPGASETKLGKKIVKTYAEKCVTVVIRTAENRTILGPPQKVIHFMQKVKEFENEKR